MPHPDPAVARARLAALRAEVIAHPDNAALRELGYDPLFIADPEARVLIVSQAPGRRAQASGVPWDDLSGDRLRGWLGMDRATFYDPTRVAIVPMDFYFPGKAAGGRTSSGDAPPRRGFADRWHPPILAELTEVRLTLLIGAYAQRHYLGRREGAGLTETVRGYPDHLPERFPLVHPSPLNQGWWKRNPWFDAEVVPALRARVREALDEPGPDRPPTIDG